VLREAKEVQRLTPLSTPPFLPFGPGGITQANSLSSYDKTIITEVRRRGRVEAWDYLGAGFLRYARLTGWAEKAVFFL
jgi:hypothetical protein